MTLELRQLTRDDWPQYDAVRSEAFARGRPAQARNPDNPADVFLPFQIGLFDGARLVAGSTTHDLRVAWGDVDAPLGGLAGVACVADQRGRGHVGRLIRESLIAMRESGQYLSGLYPFAYAFYRRYGWDWAGEKRRNKVPLAEIPSFLEGAHVRRVEMPDALAIAKMVYARTIRRYRGMTTRETVRPNWWNDLNDRDGRSTYVHVYENPQTSEAEGYLVFRFPESGDTAEIGDFFVDTPEAYRGLLSILHYYATQLGLASWDAPMDDLLPLCIMNKGMETTTVRPLFMGRVVDVAAAFAALKPPADVQGKVVMGVEDTTCDWNSGSFAIEAASGALHIKRTDAEPGVTLDIQTLSQAYWGQPSLDLLRRAGRGGVTDEGQFKLLSRLLPASVCYLQDFF